MSGLGKIARAGAGVVVVVVLIATINMWYGQYKIADKRIQKGGSTNTSASIEPTAVTPVQAAGSRVAILVDGLSLSSQAATGTKAVRSLKKGEQLVLVGVTANRWLQLRDSNGKFGYVANNTAQVKVQK